MKNLIGICLCFVCMHELFAQETNAESEIKKLEQMEVQATLKKDTVVLLRLWDKDYAVNAPNNKINFGGKNTLDRPVLRNSRISFTRDVEEIMIRGNVAVSMGSETVVPTENQGGSAQVIKRRFTNIWMLQDNSWKLIARHANVICP